MRTLTGALRILDFNRNGREKEKCSADYRDRLRRPLKVAHVRETYRHETRALTSRGKSSPSFLFFLLHPTHPFLQGYNFFLPPPFALHRVSEESYYTAVIVAAIERLKRVSRRRQITRKERKETDGSKIVGFFRAFVTLRFPWFPRAPCF